MTAPKRFTSWRDLRAQAARLQSLEQFLAQAQQDLADLTEAHGREKQQWLERLQLLELNIKAMRQGEQELSEAVHRIEQQRQAALREVEARSLRIAELERQLAQREEKLGDHPCAVPQSAEQQQQQTAALQSQLAQAQQSPAVSSHPSDSIAPDPVASSSAMAWANRIALIRLPFHLRTSGRPVQIALLMGLLLGVFIGLHEIWRKALQVQWPSQSPAESAQAAKVLHLKSEEPSWLEVRSLSGRSLFLGTLDGEKHFPLGDGLQVLAGRPDLVTVQLSGSPARILGGIEDVDWIIFDARQVEAAREK